VECIERTVGRPVERALESDERLRTAVEKTVSRSAATDYEELAAECFVQRMLSNSPSPLAVRVTDYLFKACGRFKRLEGFGPSSPTSAGPTYRLPNGEIASDAVGAHLRLRAEWEAFDFYVRAGPRIFRIEGEAAFGIEPGSSQPPILATVKQVVRGEPLVAIRYAEDADPSVAPGVIYHNISEPVEEIVRVGKPTTSRGLSTAIPGIPSIVAHYEIARLKALGDVFEGFSSKLLITRDDRITRAATRRGDVVAPGAFAQGTRSDGVVIEDKSGNRFELRRTSIRCAVKSNGRVHASAAAISPRTLQDAFLVIGDEPQELDLGDGRFVRINGVKRIETLPVLPRVWLDDVEPLMSRSARPRLWDTERLIDVTLGSSSNSRDEAESVMFDPPLAQSPAPADRGLSS